MLDSWSSYTVTIVWEFAWLDSVLFFLDEWFSYGGRCLNRFDCTCYFIVLDSTLDAQQCGINFSALKIIFHTCEKWRIADPSFNYNLNLNQKLPLEIMKLFSLLSYITTLIYNCSFAVFRFIYFTILRQCI